MKGIYLSQDLSHAGGIEKKILKQIEEFELNDISIDKQINPKRTPISLLRNVLPFFSVQYFHTKKVDWNKYDFAYIRKPAILDKSVLNLVKKAKKKNPGIIILMEMPTFPYLDEFTGLIKLDVQIKEKLWVHYLKNYIDKIVTYSDDKEILGISCLNISNAYEFKSLPVHTEENDNNDDVHLLGVAALCFYHGYDRVIEGLKNYYSNKNQQRKVYFTLVGDGPVLKDYQKMVETYQLQDYINLVGRKKFKDLDIYYERADIGIDSLARHRSGIFYNSSLKGKEYLAKGLPIISGVKTDLDDRKVSFYYRVANDDTALDINKIVEWYDRLYLDYSKKEFRKYIFNFGRENFSFQKTFEPVLRFLKEEKNERIN